MLKIELSYFNYKAEIVCPASFAWPKIALNNSYTYQKGIQLPAINWSYSYYSLIPCFIKTMKFASSTHYSFVRCWINITDLTHYDPHFFVRPLLFPSHLQHNKHPFKGRVYLVQDVIRARFYSTFGNGEIIDLTKPGKLTSQEGIIFFEAYQF